MKLISIIKRPKQDKKLHMDINMQKRTKSFLKRDYENESFTSLMTTLYNPEDELLNEEVVVDKNIEIKDKKIRKLKTSLEKRKLINKRLLTSLRKKKEDLSGVAQQIREMYTKVSKMSLDFEEDFIEREKLKNLIQQNERKHKTLKNVLNETYKEMKGLREVVTKRDFTIKELTEKVITLEKEKNDLRKTLEEEKKEYMKLKEIFRTGIKSPNQKKYDVKVLTLRDQNEWVKLEK